MKIYGDSISGNCLKVKYVCDLLAIPHEWVETSVLKGEVQAPEIKAKNPAAQVPFVEFDDGRILCQSNAIMRYLAKGSTLIPENAFDEAQMDAWLFWEQYSHEPNIAVIRFQHGLKGVSLGACDQARIEKGYAALDLMESHLTGRCWFAGRQLSLADLALFAYTQFAEEGGFKLIRYPKILNWLGRVSRDLC